MTRPAPTKDRPPHHTKPPQSTEPNRQLGSRQVTWWSVWCWAQQQAASHGIDPVNDALPLPGTPSWCGMPDGDARKLCAVLLAGAREALRHDTEQEAKAQASQGVSASADWSALGRSVAQGRGPAYILRQTRQKEES